MDGSPTDDIADAAGLDGNAADADAWVDLPPASRADLLLARMPFPGETRAERYARLKATFGLMDSADLAALVDASLGTIGRWRAEGVGPPAVRVSRIAFYRISDVKKWLDANLDGVRATPGRWKPQ